METRCLIDFNQPGLRFAVNENVEAEDLKTQRALNVLRFGRSVSVCQLLVTGDGGLDRELFYFLPALGARDHFGIFGRCLVNVPENLSETALVARVVVTAHVLLKIVGVLVDGVVRQVHVQIAQVAANGRNVLRRGEASQALVVDKNAKRRD